MQIIPNKPDPPDSYVLGKGARIPMEITRAEMGLMDRGRRKSSLSFIYSIFDLVEELNAKLIFQNMGYFLELYIEVPVHDPRNFKHELENELRAFMEGSSNYAYDEYYFFAVGANRERVGIAKVHGKANGQFLRANIGQKGDINSCLIQDQTNAIYAHIVEQKNRIMSAIEGEKWLAIYNGYPLAEEHNIREALANLARRHCFARIFVVDGKDRVFDFEEQSSNSACN